jgi:hypothetical protein
MADTKQLIAFAVFSGVIGWVFIESLVWFFSFIFSHLAWK